MEVVEQFIAEEEEEVPAPDGENMVNPVTWKSKCLMCLHCLLHCFKTIKYVLLFWSVIMLLTYLLVEKLTSTNKDSDRTLEKARDFVLEHVNTTLQNVFSSVLDKI